MRRIMSYLSILAFLLSFVPFSVADNVTRINELEISVQLPADTYVFSQKTSPYDPVWKDMGYNSTDEINDSIAYLEQKGIYLDDLAKDYSYEIVFFGKENETYNSTFNLSDYSDKEIMDLFSDTNKTAESNALIVESTSLYKTNDLKFFVLSGATNLDKNTKMFARSYSTVINGKMIQIVMQTIGNALTNEDISIIENVVDSIKLEENQSILNDSAEYNVTKKIEGPGDVKKSSTNYQEFVNSK